jgi:hypothetical protein
MTVTVTNSSVTYNIFAMSNGDFNGSLIPNGAKDGSGDLQLTYTDTKKVGVNTEFELPVRIVHTSTVGAVSLILNFPADLVDVKEVYMLNQNDQLDWAVRGNELRIGWNSLAPLNFAANADLVILRLKTTDAFTIGKSIRLTLAPDPLNELADNNYSVIPDAILNTDLIDGSPIGIPEPSAIGNLSLENHPNPFDGFTVIDYTLPYDGKVTLVIHNLLGSEIKTLVNEPQTMGDHSLKFDSHDLAPGVYTATIRLVNNNNEISRTIKLVRNR